MNLTDKRCTPCEGGTPPLGELEIKNFLGQLRTDWEVINNRKIRRQFKFKDFKTAVAFVNKVADLAESENHHPDIHIYYNRVIIELWTHSIDGLSENDFILAAKVE